MISVLMVFVSAAMASRYCYGAPNYWGCQHEAASALPYCNASWSIDDRVDDLIGRLTLEEKVSLISPQRLLGDTCATHTSNIVRIGFPQHMWIVETNTVVNSACLSPTKCATQFAGPLSTAASFNRTLWHLKGHVLATEQRALANIRGRRFNVHSPDFIGITAFGPNINQQRDPRYGRSSELPGEDPYLAGQYAASMVRGMQEPTDLHGRPKVLAYLKHFAAYNRETDRGHDDYNVTLYDLFDTYLAQFEIAAREGKPAGVMCSYNAINGRPSCANTWLLNHVLRERWNWTDAHVTTDCGAISSLLGAPVYAPDPATAAAWALNNGTDLEMGSTAWADHLVEAIRRNQTTIGAVDEAIRRGYRPHFVAGRFDRWDSDGKDGGADGDNNNNWSELGINDIRSPYHERVRLEAALQGLVLLKNSPAYRTARSGGSDLYNGEGVADTQRTESRGSSNLLPLKADTGLVAVLGPLAHTRHGLMSDYENDQSCYGGGHHCIPTLAESIRAVNGDVHTLNATGVDVDSNATDGIALALDLAKAVDVVVLCLGITKDQERENVDRVDTALPGLQNHFAQRVFAIGTPVVLVLVNGGQVAIDDLVGPSAAIIEAFNPNDIGGIALAQTLFGLENRWGKLPYTLYPYRVMQSFDMVDHSMTNPPGRTYRYFTGEPVFPFGFGLSYSKFLVPSCNWRLVSQQQQGRSTMETQAVKVDCLVQNAGKRTGDEVLQVYHSFRATNGIRERVMRHPVPIRRLVQFERVSQVEPGSTAVARLAMDNIELTFGLINEKGDRVMYSGVHTLFTTTNGMDVVSRAEFHIGIEGDDHDQYHRHRIRMVEAPAAATIA
jgi:beta-glucosidase-like glycosyl hydrolase